MNLYTNNINIFKFNPAKKSSINKKDKTLINKLYRKYLELIDCNTLINFIEDNNNYINSSKESNFINKVIGYILIGLTISTSNPKYILYCFRKGYLQIVYNSRAYGLAYTLFDIEKYLMYSISNNFAVFIISCFIKKNRKITSPQDIYFDYYSSFLSINYESAIKLIAKRKLSLSKLYPSKKMQSKYLIAPYFFNILRPINSENQKRKLLMRGILYYNCYDAVLRGYLDYRLLYIIYVIVGEFYEYFRTTYLRLFRYKDANINMHDYTADIYNANEYNITHFILSLKEITILNIIRNNVFIPETYPICLLNIVL